MNYLIIKNTIYLFLRMFVILVLGLLTTRFLLIEVGINDFGIFILAGSIISLSAFIVGSINSISTRFISITLNQGLEETKKIFSKILNLHLLLFIILSFVLLAIYNFFVENFIKIDLDNRVIFKYIYIYSSIIFLLDILKSPYNSMLIAMEKIGLYSIFEVIIALCKFLSIFLIGIFNNKPIIVYTFYLFTFSLIIFVAVVLVCIIKIEECRVTLNLNNKIKDLVEVSLWDLYGNFCSILRFQGITIIINNFFGTIIVAAIGIATQIQTMGMMIVSNLNTAFKSKIFKSYAENDINNFLNLLYMLTKVSTLILLIILIPIYIEMKFLLDIWLRVYPSEAIIISRLIVVFLFLSNLSMCLILGLHSVGDYKRPSIINGTIYLMVPTLSYILYKNGLDFYWSFVLNIVVVSIGMLLNSYYLKDKIKEFSRVDFFVKNFLKYLVVGALVFLVICSISSWMKEGYIRFFFIYFVNFSIFLSYIYLFMFDLNMKKSIVLRIKNLCKSR